MAENEVIELKHFIYGSHEGYKVKARSHGLDVDMFDDAFQGFFVPVSQADVRYLSDVRIILPVSEKYICLSHIIKGAVDEYQRGTLSNHTAVIPRKYLAEGKLTYDDVDDAMNRFEKEVGDTHGKLEPLRIEFEGWGVDLSELKEYISKEHLEKLMNFYKEERDANVFLRYKGSDAPQRIKTAYLLSLFMDIGLNITPLSIFTDVPYPDAKKIFNLIIARSMISIRPGQGWKMLPIQAPPTQSIIGRGGGDPVKDIYS